MKFFNQFIVVSTLIAFAFAVTCTAPQVKNENDTDCISKEACPNKLNVGGTQCVATCTQTNVTDPLPGHNQCVCKGNKPKSVAGDTCLDACGNNQTAFNNICVCNSGKPKSVDGNSCLDACPYFSPKNVAGDACLDDCPAGKPLNVAGDQCLDACGENQTLTNNVCACNSGKIKSGYGELATCLDACPAGQVKNIDGSNCIDSCGDSQVKNVAGDQCVNHCPSNTVKNTAGDQCQTTASCKTRVAGDQCVASCSGNFMDPIGATAGAQCICVTGKALGIVFKDCSNDCTVNANPRVSFAGDTCVAKCNGNFADPASPVAGSRCVCATGKIANADKSDCISSTGCKTVDAAANKCTACNDDYVLDTATGTCTSKSYSSILVVSLFALFALL